MITQIPFFEPAEGEVAFAAEPHWPAAAKQRLLNDWRRFVYSGFKKLGFTADLSRFLSQECGLNAHYDQAAAWAYYFNSDLNRLRLVLNRFGGNRQAPDGTTAWLNSPAADLKAAMCEEVAFLYAPLSQVLQDLETRHEELIRVWREFALACGIQADYPAHYVVGENTRNLLAYAAAIARQRSPLLPGLQLCFSPYLLGATAPQPVLINPLSEPASPGAGLPLLVET